MAYAFLLVLHELYALLWRVIFDLCLCSIKSKFFSCNAKYLNDVESWLKRPEFFSFKPKGVGTGTRPYRCPRLIRNRLFPAVYHCEIDRRLLDFGT